MHPELHKSPQQRPTQPSASHSTNDCIFVERRRLDSCRHSWHKLLRCSSEFKFSEIEKQPERRPGEWKDDLLANFRFLARLHVYTRVSKLSRQKMESKRRKMQ